MAAAKKNTRTSSQKTSTRKSTTKKNSSSGRNSGKSSSSRASKSSQKGTSSRKSAASSTSRSRSSLSYEEKTRSRKETILLVSIAVCAFLFLSNMNICGKVGEVFSHLQRGCFGMLGYLFPIGAFLMVLYLLKNGEDPVSWRKAFVMVLVFLLFCGFTQMVLMRPGTFDPRVKAAGYYELALEENNGGAVGGVIVSKLYPAIGSVGTFLLLMVLIAVGIVFVFDKSIIRPLRKGSRELYDRAVEERERRQELREQRMAEREEAWREEREQRKRRTERKIQGVAFHTSIRDQEEVETLQGEIHGIDNGYRSLTPEENSTDGQSAVQDGPFVTFYRSDRSTESGLSLEENQKTSGEEKEKAPEEEAQSQRRRKREQAAKERESRADGSWKRTGAGPVPVTEGEIPQRAAEPEPIRLEKMPSAEQRIQMIPIRRGGVEGDAEKKNGKGALVASREERSFDQLNQLDRRYTTIRDEQPEELLYQNWNSLETPFDPENVEQKTFSDAGVSIETPKDTLTQMRERFQEKEEDISAGRPFTDRFGKLSGMDELAEESRMEREARFRNLQTEDVRKKTGRQEMFPDRDKIPKNDVDRLLQRAAASEANDRNQANVSPAHEANDRNRTNASAASSAQAGENSGIQAGAFAGVSGVNLAEGTRTVTTASGQVIEAQIDPDDDPIMRKRQQKNESIWASGDGKNRTSSGGHSFAGSDSSVTLNSNEKEDSLPGLGSHSSGNAAKSEAAAPPEPPKPPLLPYETPPLDLLALPKESGKMGGSDQELRETAVKLEQTLRSFGVGVTMSDISCGPSVTRYELQPEVGVKVSKIVSLADDIKLNLAAEDIRIEAPIPGKAAVGIEVPNKVKQSVPLREVLSCDAFQNHKSKLAFALGRNIGGECVVTDLAKMPHLLIAGQTGSGKSVCINTLIMSILYKAKPSEVEMIMIDPKVVELSVYNGIPHLKIPVVTDPKKASAALNWAVSEMTDRYARFAAEQVRDIHGYNAKVRAMAEKGETDKKPMTQMVIIVDELADLMMVAPGEVEDAICRLAQMARAAGIHLVLATQRPSVNVITGLIKANVPSRIAFSVASGVDSRTILDMTGAEKLLGKGDMLFYPAGSPKPVRVQGAFVSDEEVSAVVEFLSARASDDAQDRNRDEEKNILDFTGKGDDGVPGSSELDSYFEQAGRFLIEKDKASIGMLQRAFKIGFNRAARIMEQLADAGVVGEEEGTKPRKILVTLEEFENMV